MAEKKSRAAARKIKDKWKAKVWYNLLAPEMFNKQALGETPTDDPGKLVGRVTEVTVQDLTGDFAKMHIKLAFRVDHVQGQDALTQFVGHDMTSDYIRRLTRRKRTGTGEAGAGPRRARAGRTPSGRPGRTLSRLSFRRPVRTYGAAPAVCSRTLVAWVVDGPPTGGARSRRG